MQYSVSIPGASFEARGEKRSVALSAPVASADWVFTATQESKGGGGDTWIVYVIGALLGLLLLAGIISLIAFRLRKRIFPPKPEYQVMLEDEENFTMNTFSEPEVFLAPPEAFDEATDFVCDSGKSTRPALRNLDKVMLATEAVVSQVFGLCVIWLLQVIVGDMFISDMPLAQLQDELDSIPATELEDMRINLADTLMDIETTLDALDMVDDSMVSKTGLVPPLMFMDTIDAAVPAVSDGQVNAGGDPLMFDAGRITNAHDLGSGKPSRKKRRHHKPKAYTKQPKPVPNKNGWFKGNQPDDAVEGDDGRLEFDADFHRNKRSSRKRKPRKNKGDDSGLEFDCEFVKNIPDLIDQLEDLQPMLTEYFVGDGVIIDKLIDLLSEPLIPGTDEFEDARVALSNVWPLVTLLEMDEVRKQLFLKDTCCTATLIE